MSGSGDDAMAAGAAGAVFTRSLNRTWQRSSANTHADLHGALIDSGNWYVAGRYWYVAGTNGTLLATPDHGATWQSIPLGVTTTLYGVEEL